MNVEVKDMNFFQLMKVDREQFGGALKFNPDGSKLKLSELETYRQRVVAAQAKKLRLDQERAAAKKKAEEEAAAKKAEEEAAAKKKCR